jgi:hypothetical protein
MACMGFEQAEFATGLASVLLIVCVRVCVGVSKIERGRWRDKGRETESQGAEVGGGRESPRTSIRTHTQTLCRNCLHNAEFYSSQLLLGRALGRYLDGTREGKAF